MYPFVRLIKDMYLARRAPDLPIMGIHVSQHRCWPQDIDAFIEMNNGRILTILDLGRTVLAKRVGLLDALKEKRWGLTMAGVSVRYRKRIRPFVKFKTVSRAVGWDDKFFYLEQSIWIGNECAVQALYRSAVTDKNGIVRPRQLFDHIGYEGDRPPLPAWAQNWIDADQTRPWPPEVTPDTQS
ncbi:MAG: acyl-CoA thioesterase [Yoonia sp.]|uniref:acyl-CoA thioesterase n=1 Tax=Rhodobacterales TaxID=204455 RepID=UPI001FF34B10|nr:acyl-CoA thioesterase [Loktanella sp. F6476L]MCK0120501.1 thioesterase family protein [Loktanella sp. F6476L]UWQ99291.1 thioesterase family protein [Rhodobacteraceae bacterium S2214]